MEIDWESSMEEDLASAFFHAICTALFMGITMFLASIGSIAFLLSAFVSSIFFMAFWYRASNLYFKMKELNNIKTYWR